ncbi:hypothetical protein METEAL_16120 [Mesoterricola silvestris]|uniref:histidine kinase n=2 Tax=Mesoterricola silvestris TaxID=2927979 RepID=A0AA48H5X1_9BACT|nr:hypothetical protein METEAL_16120 [Mesoterricola silvestris]
MDGAEPVLDVLGTVQASEARYRALVEASAQIVWTCDARGRVTEDSPSWRAYTGQTPGEWLGLGFEACIHPEDRLRALETWHRGLREGRRVQQEYRLWHHSGQWRWNHVRAVPLLGPGGAVESWVGMNMDIHDRLSAQRMQTALYGISEAARGLGDLYVRIHGIIKAFMPAENFYVALLDPGGDTVRFPYFVDENDAPPPALRMARGLTELVLRSGAPWRLDPDRIEELVRGGTVVLRGEPPLDWLGVPLSMDGRILGMLAVQSYRGDVHYSQSDLALLQFVSGQIAASLERQRAEEERKRLEADLQHAQKLESLGSLAGGVAHDMNNVLGAIHAVTQTLKAAYAGEDRLLGSIGTIERAAVRGRDLVKGLADFARKDLREACAVDLNEVVGQECELLSRTLLQRVRLDVALEPGLPRVMGEPGALGSAFMNLCVNAVDAMPEGGALVIRTRSLPGDLVELAVDDTGQGMEPWVLQRAMEPFYTTKPYGKGTGLGLAMVYSTAKAHGGTLTLDSRPGEGTRVRLRLPALAGAPAPAAAEPVDTDPGRPLRILLVDDDDLIRDAAPELLELLGHRVATASSGPEGLAMLDLDPDVDVVLLDVNMPGMSGLETLALLRERHPRLPVILATGFLGDATRHLLATDPHLLALAKPYTLEEARVRLKEAVSR